MQTGTVISGVGHGGVILYVLLGGLLFTPKDAPAVAVTEVSLMSGEEFAAMMASSPAPAVEPAPVAAPEPPAAEEPPTEAVEAATPEPPPAPEPLPEPEAAPPPPEPETEPLPEPTTTELAPLPEPDAPAEVEPAPPQPDVMASLSPVISPRPRPRPDERVAPNPVEEPPEDLPEAPEVVEEVAPEPLPDVPVVQEEQTAAAPEEAGEVLETEANTDDVASGGPTPAPRPQVRPADLAERAAAAAAEAEALAAAVAEAATEPKVPAETAEAAEEPAADPLAEAVAEAVAEAETTAALPATSSGPPMTGAEKDAMRLAVEACWNVGTLSTAAMNTRVTIYVAMTEDGRPVTESIRMTKWEGDSEAAAKQAFEAGRRAILRCAKDGYPLPRDKYGQWREIMMNFDPTGMRF